MSEPLAVGIVHYLNSWPLAWGFRRGLVGGGFKVSYLPPAAVADGLAAGELDVGLVPAIELQRIPGLRPLDAPCVAATREVRSVLLISRCDIAAIRSVSLDENSRTSAVLVRILLAERYGVVPRYRQAAADLDSMLARSDAALLIGDPALHVDRDRWQVLDLAAEWRELTGHPFVFALWAARQGVLTPGIERPFRASLELAEAEMGRLIAEAAAETGLAPAVIEEYLTSCLSFRLGPDERAGLEEFHHRAFQLGLLASCRPLRFHAN